MAQEMKVALVSGASRGIGAGIAARLAGEGYRIFGTSRRGTETADPGIEMLPLEVSDDASVRDCVAEVMNRAGRIDVLVNNVGYDLYAALEETPMADFIDQVDTNFFGAVRLTKAVLPHMQTRKAGRIVMIGSLGGVIGLPFNSAYAASKFALHGFAESLRLEVWPLGIHVSVIVAGAAATDTLDTSIREAAVKDGPYAARRAMMVRNLRAEGEKSDIGPSDFAAAVATCITAKRPRQYYLVGKQARAVTWLKALLPERMMQTSLRRMFP